MGFRFILIAAIAYFLGNFSTGLIVGRQIAGVDIRKHGSGNAGTTNMLRTLGWLPSILTLIGDMLKAVVATIIGWWLGGRDGALLAGVLVVVGHNWPVLYGFKGGKGIAASIGCVLVVQWEVAVPVVLLGILIVAITRYVSVGSIASMVIFMIVEFIISFHDLNMLIFSVILTTFAIYSHRANLARLIAGNENKLDLSKISKHKKK